MAAQVYGCNHVAIEVDDAEKAAASVRWADGKQMGVKFLRIRDEERLRKFLGVGEPQDAVQYPR